MATTTESLKPTTVNGKVVKPAEETVVAEPTKAADNKVTVELLYEMVNNYTQQEARDLDVLEYQDSKGRVVFGPGKVTVPAGIAEDLMRRQTEALEAERQIVKGTDRTSGHLGNFS